jgi:hypothetical protein
VSERDATIVLQGIEAVIEIAANRIHSRQWLVAELHQEIPAIARSFAGLQLCANVLNRHHPTVTHRDDPVSLDPEADGDHVFRVGSGLRLTPRRMSISPS